jgi:hypothetical protein
MRPYRVTLEIDELANSPEEAGRLAWEHLHSRELAANVFQVVGDDGAIKFVAVPVDLPQTAEERANAKGREPRKARR